MVFKTSYFNRFVTNQISLFLHAPNYAAKPVVLSDINILTKLFKLFQMIWMENPQRMRRNR